MHAKKTGKTKLLAVVLAMVLVFGCAAGGTLAWLMAKTDPVTNTFTVGDINIDLKEHELLADGTLGTGLVTENSNYKMVPGNKLPKDPFVTVKTNSEACWLFIEVTKSANFDTYMEFTMADGWIALAGEPGVYYREVGTNAADQDFAVLKGDTVTVKSEVTKAMMDALINGNSNPTLTVTAYAIQKAGFEGDPAAAWKAYNDQNATPTPTP